MNKFIFTTLIALSAFTNTYAQRYTFQLINVPDSIYSKLTKAYRDYEDVGAGHNVYNLLKDDDFRLQDGIYVFYGKGPHFKRQLFIYNNGIFIFSEKGFYHNIIEDFSKCIKQLHLSNEQTFLYLTVIYNYLIDEYEDNINMEGNGSSLDEYRDRSMTSIISPMKLFGNKTINNSINYEKVKESNPSKAVQNLAEYIENSKINDKQLLMYTYQIICDLRPLYDSVLSKYSSSKYIHIKHLTSSMLYGKWYNQTEYIKKANTRWRNYYDDYAVIQFLKEQKGVIFINNKQITEFKWRLDNNKLYIYNRKHNGIFSSIKEKCFKIRTVFSHCDTIYIEIQPLNYKNNKEVIYVFSFIKNT